MENGPVHLHIESNARPNSQIDATVMQLRLDTSRLLTQIEQYLRGYYIMSKVKDGQIVETVKKAGVPKANDHGVQEIMQQIRCVVDPCCVQGNWTDEARYDSYIYRFNLALVRNVVTNAPLWGVVDEDITPTCDFIMNMLEPFMTRLIKNEERKSYGASLQTNEHVEHTQGSGMFSKLNPFK